MRFIVPLMLMLMMPAYLCWHLWHLVPGSPLVKWGMVAVVVVLMATAFASVSPLKESLPLMPATMLYEVGTSWLVVMFYLLLTFLVADVLRLLRVVPSSWLTNNWWTVGVLCALLALLLVGGNINYNIKHRVELRASTHKPLPRPLRIVMASDLHVGFHNQRAELARWIDMINAEHPDMVLFAGDIIDGAIRPLYDFDAASEFRRIDAPVYACLGNHEYIAGLDRSVRFYRDAGITLLRDSSAVSGGVRIVGRDDRSNPRRKPLSQLLPSCDSLYTILLDHQPYNLDEARRCGIDYQLSGHTHRGQIWPLSLLVDRLYECSYGSYTLGSTHYYVSSGLGIWGGKFRIGTRSEYVVIEVE